MEDKDSLVRARGLPCTAGASSAAHALPTTTTLHCAQDFTHFVAGAFKRTKRQARQYMNRKAGFNRPLPPEATGKRQQVFISRKDKANLGN